jgi:hypothetical protein
MTPENQTDLLENPSLQDLAHQLEVLAKENAVLRGQISLSGSDKLLQKAFTDGALLLRNESNEDYVNRTQETSRKAGEVVEASALAALEEQCKKNVELDRKVSQLENEILPPLRNELARLTADYDKLVQENSVLRDGATSNTLILEQQLKCTQDAEAALRNDFDSLRSQSNAASQFVGATLRRLVDAIENVRADILRAGDKAVVVSSLQRRHQQIVLDHAAAIQNVINDAELSVESEKAKANFLARALDDSNSEVSQKSVLIRTLEISNNALKARIADMEAEERSFNMPSYQDLKRRRLEVDSVAENFVCRRKELIEFWFDGHEKIEILEDEVLSARALRTELHNIQVELLSHKRDRSIAVESVVALSEEVERLRDELIHTRSRALGLESENEALVRELGKLLSSQIGLDEVFAAANAIRVAGEQAAAATTQAVVDPVALQEALQRSQEIRQEIHQLAQRRDELLLCIQLREARLGSLDATVSQLYSGTPAFADSFDQRSLLDELDLLRSELAISANDKQILARDTELKVNELQDLLKAACKTRELQQIQIDAAFFVAHSAVSIANCTSSTVVGQLEVLDRQYNALRKMAEDTILTSLQGQAPTTPQPSDLGTICDALADHIRLMKETIESEGRRHSVHETEYILALLGELRNKEATLSASKQRYDEGIDTLHSRLAQQLEAVRGSWTTSLNQSLSTARGDLTKLEFQILSSTAALPQQPSLQLPVKSTFAANHDWDQRASNIARCTATLAEISQS